MKIGDKVTVRNRLTKYTEFDDNGRLLISWRPFTPAYTVPVAIYLGTTFLYDGMVEWGDEYEGNTFDRTAQQKVCVVQPLDAGGRYRRPVYALPEDVEVQA